jgi:hypothetical protein
MSHLLAEAAEQGDTDKLQRLLDGGADIEWKHKGTGRTALITATIADQLAAVALLLDRGANIDHQCQAMGHTALAWACYSGNLDIARLLVDRGAHLDLASPKLKRTALMSAAQAGRLDAVELLLEKGADAGLLDYLHKNALSLATDNGHQEIVDVLKKAGTSTPAPVQEEEALPWPAAGPEVTTDPVTVVRAYMLAQYEWEQKGNRLQSTGGMADDRTFWQEQDEIRAAHCTVRPRAYTRGGFGFPTEYAPDDVLVSVERAAASRTAVLIRNCPARPRLRYEHLFVVKKAAGEWRIDSVKKRRHGTTEWKNSLL